MITTLHTKHELKLLLHFQLREGSFITFKTCFETRITQFVEN